MSWFDLALLATAIASGATATVVGFGIGSLLTPLLAARLGADVAVAVVAIPHAAATLARCWLLRRSIDRAVLLRFGFLSAAGGLCGALFYTQLGGAALIRTLGVLLLLTATAGLTGWADRWHPRGPLVWLLGALSGFFGGIVGNQGGLRAAALSAFGLSPAAFVATSTATGVLVDAARTPIYVWRAGAAFADLWVPMTIATAGVLAGTMIGERILFGLTPARFRVVVSSAIGVLGTWLLASAV